MKYKDNIKINKLYHEFCENPGKLLTEYTEYILWDQPLISIEQEFKNFANINSLKLKKMCNIIFDTKNIHVCYDGKTNYNHKIKEILTKF